MGALRQIDFDLLDYIFEMKGGYVLDFSNNSFGDFLSDELGINIYNSRYSEAGTSKAKRFRSYLKQSNKENVLKALQILWEYRETKRNRLNKKEEYSALVLEFFELIERLGGKSPSSINRQKTAVNEVDEAVATDLLNKLKKLGNLNPQSRGYAFEKFLKELFDIYGLSARASFRLVGEQIDGSFNMNDETYLLEAKWTNQPIGVCDLRSFNAKVQDKAPWSRGLFISNSGFSKDGLQAFGSGKSLVCIDGLDLSEILIKKISFPMILATKVRRAAETGQPFVRVRDLV